MHFVSFLANSNFQNLHRQNRKFGNLGKVIWFFCGTRHDWAEVHKAQKAAGIGKHLGAGLEPLVIIYNTSWHQAFSLKFYHKISKINIYIYF